jgi:hypothetical protein
VIARALIACVLVACKSSPSAPPIVRGTAEKPIGPAPSIAWVDNGFEHPRLPAVSEDGSTIVLAISDDDGERGFANLRLALRDRDNRETEKHVVLAAADGDAMFDANGPTPEFRSRIEASNRWLSAQHARVRLVAMTQLEVTNPRIGERATATAGDVRITVDRARVRIDRGTEHVLDRQTPADWNPAPSTTARCTFEPQLAAAWIDVERRVAIVKLAFAAGDACGAPPARHDVVAW